MLIRLIIFLLLNFGALALDGLFMGEGPQSDWYQQLNKAPWTPPGWTFGAAWTTIMLCFSVYLALLWSKVESRPLLMLPYLIWLLIATSLNGYVVL